MPRLDSNTTWFTLDILGGPKVEVYSFTGSEEVSAPYEFSIEVISQSKAIELTDMLGHEALLKIADHSGAKRLVHGILHSAEQGISGNKYTHYRCSLVPRFWFLDKNREHRIFQNLSVVQIIEKLLKEQGFTANDYDFKVQKSYPPREYCVQYGESDKHFISRLLEEEGIYYYFEHSEKGNCICFSDAAGGAPINGQNDLRFLPGSGQLSDSAVIARMNLHGRVNSDGVAFKEWNFEKPKLDLSVDKNEPEDEKAPVAGGINYEWYKYPNLYQDKGEGQHYVELQLLRQLTYRKWVTGESDVSRLNPGFTFALKEHKREDLNRSWWITKVKHTGEQPQVLRHEAPSERGFSYNASFEALPDDIRFMPVLKHHKKLIIDKQTALVTGPPGTEIYPDKHGRVKVQFFWDREGKWDQNTTCWIRVSQSWAGGQYGTMAVPRVGHEVIVSFLEGNPDRPLITGRVYHGINTSPYELPAHKTRSVFKSLSSPGGGGFNELRVEDKKGEEEVYSHAEKDVNVYVKNDWSEHILHDQGREIGNFSYSLVKQEDHQNHDQPRKTELKDEDHLTVHNTFHSQMDGKWLVKAGQEIHLESLLKTVIEAGVDLTIKAGPSFVRLNPAGVTIVGPTVKINSGGSPGVVTPAKPLVPEGSELVNKSPIPVSQKLSLKNGAKRKELCCPMCEAAKKGKAAQPAGA